MTVHAVVSAEADYCALDAATLDELQWEQFQHDEKYHREIVRLTVHERWKHMALHFAKYAGNLALELTDEERLQRTVIDTFIIALSTSTTLNVRASELCAAARCRIDSAEEFFTTLVVAAGRMAASCEKLDHVESFPFRDEIAGAVSELLAACVTFSIRCNWDVSACARERLRNVKKKSIFYGRI